jgi:hypothetical protein
VFNGKQLTVLILAVVVSAGSGYALGASVSSSPTGSGSDQVAKKAKVSKTSPKEVSVGDNKVVKYVSKSVSGKVKSVSGQTITLEENGDSLSFAVAPSARITRITVPSPTALPEETSAEPTQEQITLEQIQVGANVDATLTSQPDGSFAATEVTVMVESE